jgi:hypothetical protein
MLASIEMKLDLPGVGHASVAVAPRTTAIPATRPWGRPDSTLTPGYSALRKLAMLIEPNAGRLSRWWSEERIAEFGNLTAAELVARGQGASLEGFLKDVLQGRRG